MDELKLKLGSKIMKGMVTSLLKKMIKSKTGCHVDIQLNDLDVSVKDGKAHIHIDIDGDMNNDEFTKLLKNFM